MQSTKRRIIDDDEDDDAEFEAGHGEEESKPKETNSKKQKTTTATAASTTAAASTNGNSEETVFSLGQKKKISLSKFKGKVYINIREYYTDDAGVDKPGKKGIALTDQQWEELKNQISNVDEALRTMK